MKSLNSGSVVNESRHHAARARFAESFRLLQAEQSAAAIGYLALFRGISPAKSPSKGNSKRELHAVVESVNSASAAPAADSESDVERVVREQMERHRALRAQRKRRAVQREE